MQSRNDKQNFSLFFFQGTKERMKEEMQDGKTRKKGILEH